ncbi:MAG: hypothetical protein Q9187_003951 [Circinaria calcarea]
MEGYRRRWVTHCWAQASRQAARLDMYHLGCFESGILSPSQFHQLYEWLPAVYDAFSVLGEDAADYFFPEWELVNGSYELSWVTVPGRWTDGQLRLVQTKLRTLIFQLKHSIEDDE